MRFAYADPPYLGCAKLYADRHPEAMIWDDPETHRQLIDRLCAEYPDGWALSLHVKSLQTILGMCPNNVRVSAACKTFGQIFPSHTQWMWEPVIWLGGRNTPAKPMVRDWLTYSNQHRGGGRADGTMIGAKPRAFSRWVFDLLGAEPGDTLDDLFPGTGAVGAAWAEYVGERSPLPQLPLEAA